MAGWRIATNPIYDIYSKEEWFSQTGGYLFGRYSAIEERMLKTFRYVDCAPSNALTFSYEYASILRDAGSVFGSVMDRTVEKITKTSKDLDIKDYRKWLMNLEFKGMKQSVKKIYSVAVDVKSRFKRNMLLPFTSLSDDKVRIDWWDVYNNVKHSDIDNFPSGNLINSLNALASVAFLVYLFTNIQQQSELFVRIGFYDDEADLKDSLFISTLSPVPSSPES
ncbi:MAG: hypothetical protein ACQCN6_04270 [Candidatus Bathyarchaeia archaeon]